MDVAVEYVAAGMALVAIPPRKKGPNTPGWHKAANAITTEGAAAAMTGNVGLAHAYSTPPTMALDIDDLSKAQEWLAERGVGLDALLNADDGVQISSGRQGRAKLIYRLPHGMAPIRTKQIVDPETGGMVLEFRCASANGLTVQDVLPPSIHPDTGKPYHWAGKGDWRDIPDQLLAVWQAQFQPTPVQSSPRDETPHGSSMITLPPETIQHLRSALLSMRADDHALWVKVGLALKPLGDVGRGLWLEWSLTSEKSQHD